MSQGLLMAQEKNGYFEISFELDAARFCTRAYFIFIHSNNPEHAVK